VSPAIGGTPVVPLPLLKWGGAAALAAVIGAVIYTAVAAPRSWLWRAWASYDAVLERSLRFLHVTSSPRRISSCQLGAASAVAVAGVLGLPFWYALLVVAVAGPALWLRAKCRARAAKLESQVNPFVTALANALKTTPSVGRALIMVERVSPAPLSEELGLCLKQMRLGATLEDALLEMAARSRSTELETVIMSILLGKQVGGNLTEILTSFGGVMREMARLAGVIRTKTASGRSQMMVLALAPVVIVLGLRVLRPGYFDPLMATSTGLGICAVAGLLWIVGVVAARKLQQVDI
jgi:tight adherence protein B